MAGAILDCTIVANDRLKISMRRISQPGSAWFCACPVDTGLHMHEVLALVVICPDRSQEPALFVIGGGGRGV